MILKIVRQSILLFTLILATNFLLAQESEFEKSVTKKTDTLIVKESNHFFIGIDLSTPLMSTFTDRLGLQGMINYTINKKIDAALEIGCEKNKFDEINWKVDISGFYAKVGFNYYLVRDKKNKTNGFYIGPRIGYASYNQEIKQYAIRNIDTNEVLSYGSRPSVSVNSFWLESVFGAKVQLFNKFYGELSIRPSIYIGGKKDDKIKPLIVPNYGKTVHGPFNLPIFWGISYQLF